VYLELTPTTGLKAKSTRPVAGSSDWIRKCRVQGPFDEIDGV
jgi:hypothetical protein